MTGSDELGTALRAFPSVLFRLSNTHLRAIVEQEGVPFERLMQEAIDGDHLDPDTRQIFDEALGQARGAWDSRPRRIPPGQAPP